MSSTSTLRFFCVSSLLIFCCVVHFQQQRALYKRIEEHTQQDSSSDRSISAQISQAALSLEQLTWRASHANENKIPAIEAPCLTVQDLDQLERFMLTKTIAKEEETRIKNDGVLRRLEEYESRVRQLEVELETRKNKMDGLQEQLKVAKTLVAKSSKMTDASVNSVTGNHEPKTVRPDRVWLEKNRQRIAEEFDWLYDSNGIAQLQRFLGFQLTMDPFNALELQDVIYDTQPDLIVEVGTRSGSVSLYCSAILELVRPDAKVITLDSQHLLEDGVARHPLWQRRVTSLNGKNISDVLGVNHLGEGKRTFVIINGNSRGDTLGVLQEASTYVTLGSYIWIKFDSDPYQNDQSHIVNTFLGTKQGGMFVQDSNRDHLRRSSNWLKRVQLTVY